MSVILSFKSSGNRIGEGHFGANYLANRQVFQQTIEGDALYHVADAAMGVSGLRYPGGTLAEKFFDISDPRHFTLYDNQPITVANHFDSDEVMPFTSLGNFLRYAAGSRESVTVVVPTVRYFDALSSDDLARIAAVEDELKAFVIAALNSRYGRWIEAFEIGNEFPSWIGGHNLALMEDSRDFAMITRNFAVWIEEAIEASSVAHKPAILGQAAFVLYGERGNKVLLEGLFDPELDRDYAHVETVEDAFKAIDGVTVHSYPLMPWRTDEYGLENLKRDAELFGRWQSAFDGFAYQSGLPRRDLAQFVTEWNTRNLAMNNGMVEGLQGATGTFASFFYLVSSGVDVMHVWPLLQTSTSALLRTSGTELSVNFNGAAFATLRANAVGLRAHLGEMHYDIDGDGRNDILAQLYTSADRAMIVVASISETTLAFDFDLPTIHFDFRSAQWHGFSIVSSSDDPTDLFAQPRVSTASGTVERNRDATGLFLELAPWTISVFLFELGGTGPSVVSGADGAAVPLAFSLESNLSPFEAVLLGSRLQGFVHLTGTDDADVVEAVPGFLVDGGSGDDTLHGSTFADVLVGGAGNDYAFAGSGDDLLLFASGDGFDEGSAFVDMIYAGPGNDTISAGGGLLGDFVDAGPGNDVVHFDSAPSLLIGGSGDDIFHFRGGEVFGEDLFAFNASSPGQIGTGTLLPVAGMNRNTSFIDGGDGYDILVLSPGDDALFLADAYSAQFDAIDTAYTGYERLVGIEEIRAGAGNDLIDLTRFQSMDKPMNFNIFGEGGDDTIWGFEGNDLLHGGDGNDVLFGGAGRDTLIGGAGADTFIFTASSNQSMIADFSEAEGDRVEFVSSPGTVFDPSTMFISEHEISIVYTDAFGAANVFTISLITEEF